MIRKLLFSISILSAGVMMAAPVSPEEALQRLEDSGLAATRAAAVKPQLVKTVTTQQGSPAVYVFNNEGGGFIVLSADDAFKPLLGYSDSGRYDASNPELAYWLGEYSRQMEYATQSGAAAETRAGITLPDWSPIAPMVKTKWNQDEPYNDRCPQDPDNDYARSYTGCVATSMAQVMNYFKFPEKGRGSNTYTSYTLGRKMSMVFSEVTFDWANMLDSYTGSYTEDQAKAVATLMLACGIAVNMDYSAGAAGSGAISNFISAGLVKYFNYDKGIRYFNRNNFTYTDWATMLYTNLKDVGPLIYNGAGAGGGHSFVFDGYDGNGYFHINWGWGGLSDGYYMIDALEPAGIGIGGGLGAFNFDQNAIFNMKPSGVGQEGEEQRDVVMYGSLQGIVEGSTLTLDLIDSEMAGWGYLGLNKINVELGVGYYPADTPDAEPQYGADQTNTYYELNLYSFLSDETDIRIDMSNMKLQDGVKYKVFCAYRQKNSDWNPVIPEVGKYDWFYLTKNGNKYNVENITPMRFSATDVSLLTELYSGSAVKVKANISNPNDSELTRSITLVLLDAKGGVRFIGANFLYSLAPNSSAEVEFNTIVMPLLVWEEVTEPLQLYPALYNREASELIYASPDPVTMYPAPETPEFDVSIAILNTPVEDNAYQVADASNFDVVSEVSVLNGYFANQLYLDIFEPRGDGWAEGIQSYPLGDYSYMNAGDSQKFNTNVNFQNGEIDGTYYLGIVYNGNNVVGGVATFVVKGTGGVESIYGSDHDILFLYDKGASRLNVTAGNGIEKVEAYYLNGMKAPVEVTYINGSAVVNLSSLSKEMIVVTATDTRGHRKSIKLAL